MPDLRGQTALVTGASSGIGAEMARLLASWGSDLVLTARRAERLEALAAELARPHSVEVRSIPLDLSQPESPARLYAEATAGGRRLDVLINNAGFGAYQQFAAERLERHLELTQLNVTSLVELTHRFVADALAADRRAYVLNVASMVAFTPIPNFSTYCGSKAYVLAFSEALALELRGTPVTVTCVCPGGTATEFSDVAGQRISRAASRTLMSAERCARIALRGMLRGRRTVIPGIMNKVAAAMTRGTPRGLTGSLIGRAIGAPARSALPGGSSAPGGSTEPSESA